MIKDKLIFLKYKEKQLNIKKKMTRNNDSDLIKRYSIYKNWKSVASMAAIYGMVAIIMYFTLRAICVFITIPIQELNLACNMFNLLIALIELLAGAIKTLIL